MPIDLLQLLSVKHFTLCVSQTSALIFLSLKKKCSVDRPEENDLFPDSLPRSKYMESRTSGFFWNEFYSRLYIHKRHHKNVS